ncbi:hypothetical protein HHK36_009254 [Tetracentron sinense]|uniref:Uncharacterized protein n=1 Tax=Tetracentron sinense TaxID=13715 RepID=A0A835DI85_TETSI|nr:hypothetical protein HHK36_009254 [Tetracentron sinense]
MLSFRNLGPVKLEPQQIQTLRGLAPVKLECQHSDQSLFLQQQQQQLQFINMSRQSSQAAAAAHLSLLQQQQRMLQLQQQQQQQHQQQQQQLLKSLPQQRSQLQQQFQPQNLPMRSAVRPAYEPGDVHSAFDALHDNNIEFWRKFVAEYFAPHAKKRWCFSLYGSGRQTTGVFPQFLHSIYIYLKGSILCRFVASVRQLAKALEVPLVNDLGYTKRYVRCLQVVCFILLRSMELHDIQFESLINFPRRSSASSGFLGQSLQSEEQQQQQTMAQNSNTDKASAAQLAASNGVISVNNSLNTTSTSISASTIVGLLHQNSMIPGRKTL